MNELSANYYKLALAHATRRELENAILFTRRALSLDTENRAARRLLGLCLYELGELDAAAAAFYDMPELTEITAERERTKETLEHVRALARHKKWRAADTAARAITYQSARVLNIRGCLCACAKKYSKASELFSHALSKDAGNIDALRLLKESAAQKRFWGWL